VVLAEINSQAIEELSKKLRSSGHDAFPVRTDVTVAAQVDRLVTTVLSKFGHIDILVNNAGLSLLVSTMEMTEDQWERIISVNMKSIFLCSQAVGRHMIKRKRGKIINIASVGAHGGIPEMVAYCSSKGGVVSFTRAIAVEWAKYNIRVNSISPGMTETPLVQKLREQSPKTFEQRRKLIPLRRSGHVQDIANLVVFLASEKSDYISGQDIIIDGGLLAIHPGYAKA
jgi:NAD(P)-dependent dehydrogenase (short-subunit alcohol dehydrogenase family)